MNAPLEAALKAIEIYASRHPRPSHVTQRQAAEMLGRSEPTIRKMIRNGDFRLNACGLIPIEQVDAALAANVQIEPTARLFAQVGSNAGLGVAVPPAPTFEGDEKCQ